MSKRVTCEDCHAPTEQRQRCDTCREAYNADQRRRRRERVEEGRCMWCGAVVLDVNPRTDDLYANCMKCRLKKARPPKPHAATLAEYMRDKGVSDVPAFALAEGADNFVTQAEAARRLGVTRASFAAAVARGRLTRHREFGKTWISVRELRPLSAAAAA